NLRRLRNYLAVAERPMVAAAGARSARSHISAPQNDQYVVGQHAPGESPKPVQRPYSSAPNWTSLYRGTHSSQRSAKRLVGSFVRETCGGWRREAGPSARIRSTAHKANPTNGHLRPSRSAGRSANLFIFNWLQFMRDWRRKCF